MSSDVGWVCVFLHSAVKRCVVWWWDKHSCNLCMREQTDTRTRRLKTQLKAPQTGTHQPVFIHFYSTDAFLQKSNCFRIRVCLKMMKKIKFWGETQHSVVCLWLSWHSGLCDPGTCCPSCICSERSSEPPPGRTRTRRAGIYRWRLQRDVQVRRWNEWKLKKLKKQWKPEKTLHLNASVWAQSAVFYSEMLKEKHKF